MIMNARNISAFKECVDKLHISKVWFKGYSEFELNTEINKFINETNFDNYFIVSDDLIINENLSDDEWFSALMQIIMILITYQKLFSFTHNDLHTNNVMYIPTNKKFIYYTYKKKTYPMMRKFDLERIAKRDLASDGDKEGLKNYIL